MASKLPKDDLRLYAKKALKSYNLLTDLRYWSALVAADRDCRSVSTFRLPVRVRKRHFDVYTTNVASFLTAPHGASTSYYVFPLGHPGRNRPHGFNGSMSIRARVLLSSVVRSAAPPCRQSGSRHLDDTKIFSSDAYSWDEFNLQTLMCLLFI